MSQFNEIHRCLTFGRPAGENETEDDETEEEDQDPDEIATDPADEAEEPVEEMDERDEPADADLQKYSDYITFFDEINKALKQCWTAGRRIAVDEMCCPFKGRFVFKQFNPSKSFAAFAFIKSQVFLSRKASPIPHQVARLCR
jgi:hypothetical protein